MPAPRSTVLRETPDAAQSGGPVIDAQYQVVGGKSRGILRRARKVLMAIFWAALVGFMIPPAWILIHAIGEMFER